VAAALLALIVAFAPAAATDRPPRIVNAAMLDTDGDARADRVRLTYSEPVRHVLDRDGRYPFTVAGYRIRSVAAAAGKALVLVLAESTNPDPTAAPAIRYTRTRSKPVTDRARKQAIAQRFSRTRAHRRVVPTQPPPAAPLDADGDGTPDAADCAPRNAAVHPGAPDVPDLDFVDSNCDRIDGNESDAIFVAPGGLDTNPGTKADPKRELQAALAAASAGKKRQVLVAFGGYGQVKLVSGISIYGGYDPASWQRRDRFPDGLTVVRGSPHGVLADGAKDVVLQHLRVSGVAVEDAPSARSAYGIRAVNGSDLTLQRVAVAPGAGAAGSSGADGRRGLPGGDGGAGEPGSCDGETTRRGGAGGTSPVGRTGGQGGRGSPGDIVIESAPAGGGGAGGTPGGAGGRDGNPGTPGASGRNGANGATGSPGAGGASSGDPQASWLGRAGGAGGAGAHGNGGGGGGGGGAQQAVSVNNGDGNGGGGGGGGGQGGTGGTGGGPGGGSFGIYLFNSKIIIHRSSITAANGGAGGRGGDGGIPGAGGKAGRGGRTCISEVGAGGNGGAGGAGGRGGGGGGGAGGPSVAIFRAGASTATTTESKLAVGTAGPGGGGGQSGPGGAGRSGESGVAELVFPRA
jgi:hypothetical protein